MARQLEVHAGTVREWRKRMDLKPNPWPGARKGLDTDKAMRLLENGLNDKQIAEHLDISVTSVQGWRKENGYASAITSKIDETEIRALYDEGLWDNEIARRMGLAAGSVKR